MFFYCPQRLSRPAVDRAEDLYPSPCRTLRQRLAAAQAALGTGTPTDKTRTRHPYSPSLPRRIPLQYRHREPKEAATLIPTHSRYAMPHRSGAWGENADRRETQTRRPHSPSLSRRIPLQYRHREPKEATPLIPTHSRYRHALGKSDNLSYRLRPQYCPASRHSLSPHDKTPRSEDRGVLCKEQAPPAAMPVCRHPTTAPALTLSNRHAA